MNKINLIKNGTSVPIFVSNDDCVESTEMKIVRHVLEKFFHRHTDLEKYNISVEISDKPKAIVCGKEINSYAHSTPIFLDDDKTTIDHVLVIGDSNIFKRMAKNKKFINEWKYSGIMDDPSWIDCMIYTMTHELGHIFWNLYIAKGDKEKISLVRKNSKYLYSKFKDIHSNNDSNYEIFGISHLNYSVSEQFAERYAYINFKNYSEEITVRYRDFSMMPKY